MPIPNLKVTLKYVFCVLSNCFIKYCNIQFYYNIGRNVSCITIHLYALEFKEGYGAMFRLFNISPHCTHIYFLISYNILYIINIVIRFFFPFSFAVLFTKKSNLLFRDDIILFIQIRSLCATSILMVTSEWL